MKPLKKLWHGRFVLAMAVILFLLLLFATYKKKSEPLTRSDFYFDTIITVTIYDSSSENILNHCFDMASQYEQMLSKTIDGSDVWKLNHANGTSISIQPETYALLSKAISYANLTHGKLDLTIGSVSELWDFSQTQEPPKIPSSTDLANALSHVNYQTVHLESKDGQYFASLTDKQSKIDLGFIAKGYIADQMKAYLLSEGIQSANINLGGNILTIGSKPDGSPFRIGIRKPFSKESAPLEILSVYDQSVVTSGIYERYFLKDNKIYHHILDVTNGYPIDNDLYSVTIISNSSTSGDALSTSCLILGLEKGMALVESMPDCEAIFVTSTYQIYKTTGLLS